MDIEPTGEVEQSENIHLLPSSLDEVLALIASQPKRRHTSEEINEARGNLALMNDRVFLGTFAENKNNHIITEIVNALRKIHSISGIPPIERTTVQNVTLVDVLGRGMVGDLLGEGYLINIAVEVQKGSQDDYAVRGTITSGNAMRVQFNKGDDFSEAPDVIGVNILDFRLPELIKRQMFCSRIVRAEYESKETFLADKYSDYYIELPKMNGLTKGNLPEEYHDIWDLCCIFKAKVKEHEEVIKMEAIANPVALELSNEVKKTVASSDLVSDTLNRTSELERLRKYMERQTKKAEEATKKAVEEAAKNAAQSAERKIAEKMLVSAIRNLFPNENIEALRQSAGITEARLTELIKQAQTTYPPQLPKRRKA